MKIRFTQTFTKQYKKLPQQIRIQFDNRIKLFVEDPDNHKLRLHPLKGKFTGYWSINVNGDIRAIFFRENDDLITFSLIGSHSQLYG